MTLFANALGPVQATLAISGDVALSVPVTANVVADPACPQADPCTISVFQPDAGRCATHAEPDGMACDAGDPCQAQTSCAQGVCKGILQNCDDGDGCTVDFCAPGVGCQHLDESASCFGANPCQVYYCDPTLGCQSTSAADGTPCAAEVACVHANVCFQGQCTGAPIPDGTPCVDPRDPCATDATCGSGACHSPTADALVPGDLLWQKVSSVYAGGVGGPPGAAAAGTLASRRGGRAAAAVDDLGNLYLDDVQPPPVLGAGSPGDLVSLDVCGHERWRVPYPSSQQWTNGRHLLTAGVVVTVGQDQTLVGHSQATGGLLWTFDPRQQAGLDPLAVNQFTIQDVALSANQILYYTADWTYAQPGMGTFYGHLIGGLLRNGQSKFQTLLPAQAYDAIVGYPRRFGYPLLVDENQNLYTAIDVGTDSSEILSFDQVGGPRFQIPVGRSDLNALAENHGFFVEPVSLTAFNAQGTVLWQHLEPASTVVANGHSPVIGADGNITVLRDRKDLGLGVIESYGPDGSLRWQTKLRPNEVALSSHVIDAQNLIYFATSTASSANQRVVALRESDGSQLWATVLPTAAPVYNGVLASTPAGSLVVSVTERLFGVFAGNGLSTAPWPRFRGANNNDSAAPLAGQ